MVVIRNNFWLWLMVLALATTSQTSAQEPPAIADLEKQLVAAVAKVEKSVVAVARVRKDKHEPGGGLARLEKLLRPSEEDGAATPAELGAGVIVDPRGLVLTTYHLLGDAREFEHRVHSAGCRGNGIAAATGDREENAGKRGQAENEPRRTGDHRLPSGQARRAGSRARARNAQIAPYDIWS